MFLRATFGAGLLAVMTGVSPVVAQPVVEDGSCAETAASAGAGPATATGARAGQREPAGWTDPPIEEAPEFGHQDFRVTIPVYFHVFTKGDEGRLGEQALRQQVNVLNAGFSGREGGFNTGFSFTFAGADYTDNEEWFALDYGSLTERRAKAATRVGGADTLNVWTTDGRTYLGFARYPSWYKRSPQLDGIVLDYKSFPGGAYGDAYSLGKTATHEVGHWLGLLHTFQGGCNAKGDYVDDTPAMLTPSSGCPVGKNTCKAPGDDPVRNYMDYSYDSCYDQFSQGQARRMTNQWSFFRAGGGFSTGS